MDNTHVLRILNHEGDVAVAWDPQTETSVKKAETKFDELAKLGYLQFAVEAPGKTPEQITKFDPKAYEIVAVPQFKGG